MSATENLLTTPLNGLHLELGARMVPFAGYSMPVQYPAGLVAEHHQETTHYEKLQTYKESVPVS